MISNINKPIILTGFMGSGKSTIGRRLAKQLNVKFIDTDAKIESAVGMEIKEIFAKKGEAWFRKIEEETIISVIDAQNMNIISLGGGALLSMRTLATVLESGVLIYIKSNPVEIWKRIRHSTRRPLLRHDGEEWSREMYLNRMVDLMKQREEGYSKAQIIIDRDGKEVDELIAEILTHLDDPATPGR